MFYENELNFLCETLRKSHIRASSASLFDPVGEVVDVEIFGAAAQNTDPQLPFYKYIGDVQPHTMYKTTDELSRWYIYFLLPTVTEQRVFFAGPYLSHALSTEELLEIGMRIGVPSGSQQYLAEYYTGIPVLDAGDRIFLMIDTFCERIWGSPSFSIIDVNKQDSAPPSPINRGSHGEDGDDILVNMRVMEKRYEFENGIMQAVSLGQIHKETALLSMFSEYQVERRTADAVRNVKNYCIIMNTLLRKAAEKGGVHPLYLDRISSEFAIKIEKLSTLDLSSELMLDMFRSYCKLVREHSTKSYSPVVQKTILIIDSDLSANISLGSLAKKQNISSGYLSTVFKKETGKTVSEYVRIKRMKHAMHLLATTNIQVQTVASYCGIMDVQYFSKLFKLHTGKTPTEYRETAKQ